MPPQGGNESKFGAPPGPQLNVRTMESDTRSIQRGDSMPMPESIFPPGNASEPVFRPETQVDASFVPPEEGPKKSGAHLWLWIAVGIAVVAAVVVGYFVFPIIFGGGSTETLPPPPPPTEVIPPPAPEVKPHQSFFITPDISKTEILLPNVSRDTAVITLTALERKPEQTLEEVVILDQNRSQIASNMYLKEFVTEVAAAQMAAWFEDDFTAFLYYDANGVWPGYAFKVKVGVNLDEVKANASVIEGSDLSRFYLAAPGTFAPFKSGTVSGKSTRYAIGSQPGASFNYGIIGNYLIVSTSYNGLKNALPLLGL